MNPSQNNNTESFIKYKDQNKEVRVEKSKVGAWRTWIKDLKTGTERKGYYVPGNPEDFDFDPKKERWVFKK